MTTTPIYFVLDVSGSMDRENDAGEKPIDLVKGIPSEIRNLCRLYPELSETCRFCIITYSRNAKVVVPYGHVSQIGSVGLPDASGKTYFSEAFEVLRETIEIDMNRWRGSKDEGDKVTRPIVMFFSDGIPSDEKTDRDASFRALCPINADGSPDGNAFEWYPNIFMFPVGNASSEQLGNYVFGRGIVFPSQGGDTMEQMRSAVRMCIGSITPLTKAAQLSTLGSDILELPDVTGVLFDDEDD